MKPLKYRGRPNRRARKQARRINSPMGIRTWVFSKRHDPQRAALAATGAEVMRWSRALEEMDARHSVYRRGSLSQGAVASRRMLMDDLGNAARKYLRLLAIGQPMISERQPIVVSVEDEVDAVAKTIGGVIADKVIVHAALCPWWAGACTCGAT